MKWFYPFGWGMIFGAFLFGLNYYSFNKEVDASLFGVVVVGFIYIGIGVYKWAYEDKDC